MACDFGQLCKVTIRTILHDGTAIFDYGPGIPHLSFARIKINVGFCYRPLPRSAVNYSRFRCGTTVARFDINTLGGVTNGARLCRTKLTQTIVFPSHYTPPLQDAHTPWSSRLYSRMHFPLEIMGGGLCNHALFMQHPFKQIHPTETTPLPWPGRSCANRPTPQKVPTAAQYIIYITLCIIFLVGLVWRTRLYGLFRCFRFHGMQRLWRDVLKPRCYIYQLMGNYVGIHILINHFNK